MAKKRKRLAKKANIGELPEKCEGCSEKIGDSAGECPQCGSILCERCASNKRCSACELSFE